MQKKGFTLIELLIVVAIIGILASLVLVGLGGARRAANDTRRVADLNQVRNALELYFNAAGGYPPIAAALNGQEGFLEMVTEVTSGPYNIGVSNLPTDPVPGHTGYGYFSDGIGFILGAQLDGSPPASYNPGFAIPGFATADFICDGGPAVDSSTLNYCVSSN